MIQSLQFLIEIENIYMGDLLYEATNFSSLVAINIRKIFMKNSYVMLSYLNRWCLMSEF